MNRNFAILTRLIILLVLGLILSGMASAASSTNVTFIELILDCSDTMKRTVEGVSKIETMKSAVTEFINEAPSSYRFALRIMGGDVNSSHYSSTLLAEMGMVSAVSLNEKVQGLEAAGERSLYHAMSECLYDFPDYLGGNVVILITDGMDDGNRSLESLEHLYANDPDAPRVFVLGLDITKEMETEFSTLTKGAGGRVENLGKPDLLPERLSTALDELGGNLNIYLFDQDGKEAVGDITVYDDGGHPIRAVYSKSSYSVQLEPGSYWVEAKYLGEIKKSNTIDLRPGDPKTLSITFRTRTGNLRVYLYDDLYQPLVGYIKVTDSLRNVIYEGGPDDEFTVSLPEGRYEIEGKSGTRTVTEYQVQVMPDGIRDIELSIPIVQSVLEVEISNKEAYAINGSIDVYTPDGFLIAEADYTSYLHVLLPPDRYVVEVNVGDQRQTRSVALYEGDQITVAFELDVSLGFLMVQLRTDSGYDAWGVVRIYDSQGQYSRHWSVEEDVSPDWSFELPEGVYTVEAEVENVIRTRSNVRVTENEETWVEMVFPDYVR